MTSSIMRALSLSLLVASVAAQQYQITFDLPAIIESCGSTTIGYTVTPFITQTIPITLILAVVSVDGTVNNVITRNANLTAGSYDWDPVAVRGGQEYMIAAGSDEFAGISGNSNPFSIRIGETTACLSAPTGGPGPVNPPISQAPSSGSSSGSVTQTPPPTTQSQPPSSVSSPAANSTSPFIPTNQMNTSGLSTGAKAGISIAAVVVILGALVGLYFLLIARRRTRASRARAVAAVRSQGRSSPTHEWKGLESKDYYAAAATALTASRSSVTGTGGAGSNTTVPSSMQAVNHGHDALGRSIGSGHPATVSTFSQNDVGDEKVAGYGGYPPQDAPGLAYLPAVKRTSSNGARGGTMNRSSSDASSTSIPEVRRSKGPTQRKPVPVYNPSSSEVDHSRGESSDSFIDPFNVTPIASDDSHHIFPPVQQHDLHRKGSFPNEKPMEHVLSVDPPVQRVGSPPYASASKHRSA